MSRENDEWYILLVFDDEHNNWVTLCEGGSQLTGIRELENYQKENLSFHDAHKFRLLKVTELSLIVKRRE